ncbi:hypothetical protein B0H19DRAFT_1273894 [Mycena capillaripes]|nr:hypothetical protein B0H19DRAFT_1273894 [Mycena capillaripes]
MNNGSNSTRFTKFNPVLRLMGLNSTLPVHTLVIIAFVLDGSVIAFMVDGSTHMSATLIPDRNTNDIVFCDHMLVNLAPHHNLGEIVGPNPNFGEIIVFIYAVNTRFRAIVVLTIIFSANIRPHHHLQREYTLQGGRQRSSRAIVVLTIIFTANTRFKAVDSARRDWVSDLRAVVVTGFVFIRDPDIIWGCVVGGLLGLVLALITAATGSALVASVCFPARFPRTSSIANSDPDCDCCYWLCAGTIASTTPRSLPGAQFPSPLTDCASNVFGCTLTRYACGAACMLSSLPAAPPRRCTTLPVNTLIAANAPQLQTVVPVLKCTSGSVPFVIFGPYTQYRAQVPPASKRAIPGWEHALHTSAPSKCALPIFFSVRLRPIPGRGWCSPRPRTFCSSRTLAGMQLTRAAPKSRPPKCTLRFFFSGRSRAIPGRVFPASADVLLAVRAPWHAAASLGARIASKSRPPSKYAIQFFFWRAIPGRGWCSPRLRTLCSPRALLSVWRPASLGARALTSPCASLRAHAVRKFRSPENAPAISFWRDLARYFRTRVMRSAFADVLLAAPAPWHVAASGGARAAPKSRLPLKMRPPIFFDALSPDAGGVPRVRGRSARRARSLACGGVGGSARCTQILPPLKIRPPIFFWRAIPGREWCSRIRGAPILPCALPGMRRRRWECALHPSPAPPQNPPSIFFSRCARALSPDAGGVPRVCGRSARRACSLACGGVGGARCTQVPPLQTMPRAFFFLLTHHTGTRVMLFASADLRACCECRVLFFSRALFPTDKSTSHPLGHLSSFYGDDQDAGDKGSNAGTPTTPHHPGFPYFFPQPHFLLDSLALSRISLALSEIFILWLTSWTSTRLFPLSSVLFQPPNGANDAQPPMSQASVHELKKAKFLVDRASCPYANEGPGVCYNVACAADDDIKRYRAGKLTGAQFLARLKWKVGHSGDWERRQREYAKCDVKQTHIWICRWEVNERYYCERLAQLEQFCNGGERIIERCPCGVRHREYFTFSSIGGFADFSALMMEVVAFVDESEFPTKTTRGRDCGPTKAACGWVPVPTNASSKVDKGDVQVVSNDDKGDVQVVSNGDKGDVRVVLHSDKEAGHRSRSVLRCGAWDRGTARRCVTPAVWGRTAGRALV